MMLNKANIGDWPFSWTIWLPNFERDIWIKYILSVHAIF